MRAWRVAVPALLLAALFGVLWATSGDRPTPPAPPAPPAPPSPAASGEEGPRTTPAIPPGAADLFVDVTGASGIDFVHHLGDDRMDNLVESVGAGVCAFDYDGDGDLDLYFVDQGWSKDVSKGEAPERPARSRLYRNLGGLRFEDVTDRAGVGAPGYGFGAIAADVDGDGDQDLYVLALGPNRLYRNRGDGTFEDASAASGAADPRASVAGTFFDADGDGDLDLYVGNYVEFDPTYRFYYGPDVFPGPLAFTAQPDALYLNRGDGTFEEAAAGSGLDVTPARAMGACTFDANEDGRPDLFVANDATANFLFISEGAGKFRETGLPAGVAYGFYGEAAAAMAGSVGDVDGDGRQDLLVTNASFGSLLRNQGGGRFQDRVRTSGVAALSASWPHWGGGFLDFDLDGDLDIFAVAGDLHHPTGRPDLLLANRGDGTFEDAAARGGAYFRAELLGRGGSIADLDDDGDPDLVVTNIADRAVLLENRGSPGRHWITLALRGAGKNRDAYGARVTITAAGRTWVREHSHPSGYLCQNDPRIHVGLGDAARIDRIEVRWPDGTVEAHADVAPDRILLVVQGERLP